MPSINLYKNNLDKLIKNNKNTEELAIIIRTFLISGALFGILVLFKNLHLIFSSFLNISLNPFNDEFQNNIVFLFKMSKYFLIYSLAIETFTFFVILKNGLSKIKDYLISYGIHIFIFLINHFYGMIINYISRNFDTEQQDTKYNFFIKIFNLAILLVNVVFIVYVLLCIGFSIRENKKYSTGYLEGQKYIMNMIKSSFS